LTFNISETVQDKDSYNGILIETYALLNGVISNDLEWSWVTKFPTIWSVARPLCDGWASCYMSA